MDQPEHSLMQGRDALGSAITALQAMPAQLFQASGQSLAALLGELDRVQSLATAAMVAVTEEATRRGEVAQSQFTNDVTWVAGHAPSQRAGGAGTLARCARLIARPDNAPVRAAVLSARVSPPVAGTVVREMERLRPRVNPEAVETVFEGLLAMGAEHGSRGVRMVRPRLLAEHGLAHELDRQQELARPHVALSMPVEDDGLHEFRLVLDTESTAILEAAIGPLSAPRPDPDGSGATRLDTRSTARRRAEALIELCQRAVEAGDRSPSATKASIVVTMDLDGLRSGIGAGTVAGSVASGQILGPETVRRLACDAQVVPVVLGSDGQPVDVGRTVRLFTPAQVTGLWVRDRGCSFPGCERPSHWCHAHHLEHWFDGGETSLQNAALLCARHHTIVHQQRLRGWVEDGEVRWDRVPGSYDRWLASRPPARRAGASPAAGGTRAEFAGAEPCLPAWNVANGEDVPARVGPPLDGEPPPHEWTAKDGEPPPHEWTAADFEPPPDLELLSDLDPSDLDALDLDAVDLAPLDPGLLDPGLLDPGLLDPDLRSLEAPAGLAAFIG